MFAIEVEMMSWELYIVGVRHTSLLVGGRALSFVDKLPVNQVI